MKILVAVDGSAFSDAAVAEVRDRPWPAGSEVRIISVVEPPLVPTVETWALPDDYYDELEKAAEGQAKAVVNKAAEQLRAARAIPIELTTELIRGYPKQAILDEADRWGADLIVVGSHGYSGFTRLLLGSVSQAVSSHAKCSVEIVRKAGAK
jgi:nucleotide-binding universal stress UspA family protein